MAASGVRSSCETVETKSDFSRSTACSAVRSRNAKTAPPAKVTPVSESQSSRPFTSTGRVSGVTVSALASGASEAQGRKISEAGRPSASAAAKPVIRSAAGFQSPTMPSSSTRSTPSPTCSTTSAARARSWTARYRRALSTATAARRARCHAKSRSSSSYRDRKSTRLNSSHVKISYAVFCLKKKKKKKIYIFLEKKKKKKNKK